MVGRALKTAMIAVAVSIAACSRARVDGRTRPAPTPSVSATPEAPRERRVPDDVPSRDPSLKPPQGYRRMAVGGIAPTSDGQAVVLTDDAERTGLILDVGGTEALAIALRLEHKKFARPLTQDLLDDVVEKLGGDVVAARVDRYENDVFYGSVLIRKEGRLLDVDARASDAVALALGDSVPLYVAESVLEQVGVDVERYDFRHFVGASHEAKTTARAGQVEL